MSDGGFVELQQALVRRIERLAAFQADEEQPERVHLLAALSLKSETDWTVEGDEGWARRSTEIEQLLTKPLRVPRALTADLRDYQKEGVKWALRLSRLGAGACLADDMGLGKTVQTLAVLLSRANVGPALVIAPVSVIGNWEREAARFAPSLRVLRLADMAREPSADEGARSRVLPRLGKKQVLLSTYDMAHREEASLGSVTWATLVVDEAQAIKNPAARRTRAIAGLKAGFKLALTGTPIENHLGELWSLFNVINPGLLGPRKRFSDVLRRNKSEVLTELSERTELTLEVSLSEEERKLYEASRHEALERLNKKGAKPQPIQILAKLTRLRQLCCHPRVRLHWSGQIPGCAGRFVSARSDI